eukprot:2997667-Pleurochrysis_carterae.AAC.1
MSMKTSIWTSSSDALLVLPIKQGRASNMRLSQRLHLTERQASKRAAIKQPTPTRWHETQLDRRPNFANTIWGRVSARLRGARIPLPKG